MNENAKKGILIVVALLAVIAAGMGLMNLMSADQPQVVKTITLPKEKSMKRMEMERQERERKGLAPSDAPVEERNPAGG